MFQRFLIKSDLPEGEALDKLDSAHHTQAEFLIQVDQARTVKITKKSAMPLLSGFSPVFIGKLTRSETGSLVRGYFRFHLAAVGLFVAFLGTSLLNLSTIVSGFDQPISLKALWADPRVTFELQYCGFCVLVALFAWLGGKPLREKIKQLLRNTL